MPDVIALGELLIDFVPSERGVSLGDAQSFLKSPGGAPANVAVGLAKLGVSAGFVSKVGDDAFGKFLAKTLGKNGVEISQLHFSDEAPTGLAFVSLTHEGERDFIFYRNPSADMLLRPDEVALSYIQSAKMFHIGSISLISEPSRSATLKSIEMAKAGGAAISYDPNLRLNLWPDARSAKKGIMQGWSKADYIKVSEEELTFLAGEGDIQALAKTMWHPNLRLLVVTQGSKGCTYLTSDFYGDVPGFAVEAIDTTGAGDGFVAGLLKGLLELPNGELDEAPLQSICRTANAVGAITTTSLGAIPALPSADEVSAFLDSQAN